MDRVPDPTQLPTILDAVEVWLRGQCAVCARFIDSVQICDDEDGLALFKRAMSRCPACSGGGIVEPQPPLAFHLYDMRRRLGFVPVYDPEARWTPWHPSFTHATLVVARSYLRDTRGQPKKGPEQPFIEYLMAAGLGQEVPASEADRTDLSPWPHYRLVPLGSRESRLEGDPDGAHDRAGPERRLALVELAALVNHPAVPGVATLLRWDELSSDGFSEEMLGLQYIAPERRVSQFKKLDKATREFLEGWQPHPGGRPRKITIDDVTAAAEVWRARNQRLPTRDELAAELDVAVKTLLERIHDAGYRDFEAFLGSFPVRVRRAHTVTRAS